MSMIEVTVEERVAALEQRISALERERPGRRMKPNLTSQPGVCGIDPDTPSEACPDASIYRYQQGCRGTLCVNINREYYAEYRERTRKKPEVVVSGNGEQPAEV